MIITFHITIVSAISQNYIFASLNGEDLDEIVLCMESVEVGAGENVVTQGKPLSL